MFNKPGFSYDGIASTVYGLNICRVGDSGMKEKFFGVNRSIVEEKIRGLSTPHYFGIDEEPLQFDLTMYKEGVWTDEFKQSVIKWLFQKQYKPFISDDDTSIIYYCMPTGTPKFFDNSRDEGYITLTMRCDSPYGWSTKATTDFDLSVNAGTTNIKITNSSNILEIYKPKIRIELIDGTTFSLDNLTDSDGAFTFTGLTTGEIIYVNNQRKQILTNQAGLFRYSNFNKNWLGLIQGENTIAVTGKVKVHFVDMQVPIAI